MALTFQRVTLDVQTPDHEGILVFWDGRFVAVLSCLSSIHGNLAEHWFIEAMLGGAPPAQPQTFPTLQDFEKWLGGSG